MRRAASTFILPLGIGVGFGLAAGMVGVVQWALTQHDLAERLAEFHAIQRQYPGFFDETNVDRGNVGFWAGTAVLAALVALVICQLAAFTANRLRRRWRDGMIAASVAAIVGGVIYVAAASLAEATSPEPAMTQFSAQCSVALTITFLVVAMSLAGLVAGIATRVATIER